MTKCHFLQSCQQVCFLPDTWASRAQWLKANHSQWKAQHKRKENSAFSPLYQAPLAFLNTCSTVSEMTPDSCCSAVIQSQDELHCLQLFIWFHLGVRLLPCKAQFWHHYCLIITGNIQVFGSHLSHLLHNFSHHCTLVAPLNGHRLIAVLSSVSCWLAEANLVVNFKKSNLHESQRRNLRGKRLSGWINFPSSRRNPGHLKQTGWRSRKAIKLALWGWSQSNVYRTQWQKKKITSVVKTLNRWIVFLWLYLSTNPYKSYI